MISSRCVVKAKEEKADKKLMRWNKIALEACEQCKRAHQTPVLASADFDQVLGVQADLKLIAYEDADLKACNLAAVFKEHPDISSIAVMIGPEGGFSLEEVAKAEAFGFVRVSLGTAIFRAESNEPSSRSPPNGRLNIALTVMPDARETKLQEVPVASSTCCSRNR